MSFLGHCAVHRSTHRSNNIWPNALHVFVLLVVVSALMWAVWSSSDIIGIRLHFCIQSDRSGLTSYCSKPFFTTSDWFTPCFLIQAGSFRNGWISLQWKPATILIQKCHAQVIFDTMMENCVDKHAYAVFWSYLVMFAEIVADSSPWCLVTRVNLGFTDMAICFTVTLLPVPV